MPPLPRSASTLYAPNLVPGANAKGIRRARDYTGTGAP